ncbi:TPA: hypothetical protein QC116_004392 [Bacillus thuringiensis]|uniref:hypothetical protein n=1 Tax=Bacillus cereus group TaxID=86661 RepID=UPI000871EE00|nr:MULTISPECIES: hypothetical protein [Bacillus cereus group]MBS9802957.1 hypothetical protein [Bacillus toyonensis]HDR8184935.1 hypothetical protein [Bacillus thuringiensis]MCU5474215.1 hypothetical protein [Bacillus cereus]MCU5613471.1 hypothetical protein [Bacillus cereus]MDA1826516.1 hypothetical protein [Bacillus cereus group sp. BY25LC]
MNITKIFLSYTLRDMRLNTNILKEFKSKLEQISNIHVYVDILDNKNTLDHQGEVYSQLDHADVFWKINSAQYDSSAWAVKELCIAQKCNKPIFILEMNDIYTIINSPSLLHIEESVKRFLPQKNH